MKDNHPTKVLFISGSMPPIQCGIGYYTSRLLRTLTTTDPSVEYELLTSEGTDSFPEVPTSKVNRWSIASLPRLLRQVKRVSPEIIHVEYPAVGYGRSLGINLLGYVLRLFTDKKLVVTLHEYHQSRWVGRARNLLTIAPYHKIVVSNEADVRALKLFRKRLVVMPIGSNLPSGNALNAPKVFNDYGLDSTEKTLCFFGFPFQGKGLETLLNAAQELKDYQVLLLSAKDESNPYHKQLGARVEDLRNAGVRIGWTGFLDDQTVADVCAYQSDKLLFVFPQNATLTAKAGTVIAAVINGQIVIAKDGDPRLTTPYINRTNCYLINPMNTTEVAEAVRAIESNEEMRKLIRQEALKLNEYFSWDSIANKHRSLYRSLLS
jgi:glycosyltransferase involved in cell wall biosynthesis